MTDDQLGSLRRRFPRGTRHRGIVTGFPGRAGASIDIGGPVPGWVDQLLLPDDRADWPPAGRSGLFEVLQHREDEVRLFPLDAGMRGQRCRYTRWPGPQWAAITVRWPVGTLIEATVTSVLRGNREFTVRFQDIHEAAEYDRNPPDVGASVALIVERHSEWTRALILRRR